LAEQIGVAGKAVVYQLESRKRKPVKSTARPPIPFIPAMAIGSGESSNQS
jgi:hypothetical protein